MKKIIHSFRIDEDIKSSLKSFQKKNADISFTDVVNTALHHFLESNSKKQFKYLRNYKSRLFRFGSEKDDD